MHQKQNKEIRIIDRGLEDYQQTWDFQESLFYDTIAIKTQNRNSEKPIPTPNYLIYCEHPHVYTLGKSGDPKNLLLDDKGLEHHQAIYYKVNRGGDITYHGPGQIVGYPILDLDNFFTDIHKYLRLIEEAVIMTLREFGLESGRIEGLTGVWIDHVKQERPRKICAIGVRSSRWVTMHGFAFNINTDLSYFEHIVPCGIEDKEVTSLAREIGSKQNMKMVQDKLTKHLVDLFEMKIIQPDAQKT